MMQAINETPRQVREKIRRGELVRPTAGLCPGYVQANLAVVPRSLAYDFLLFCQRNPKPCPILDVTDVGSPEPRFFAPGADLRRDIPQYRVWKHGELVDEPTDVEKYWREDLVAFLIGCSFTFETALLMAGVPVRHIEEDRNVPMYITNIACRPAGFFHGSTVVSMRPMRPDAAIRAVQVTSRFPGVHGAPLHIGDPAAIGIADVHKPDFGDSVTIHPGEVPVFWACGVTPQAAIMAVKPEFAITHAPGCMFIADPLDSDYAVF